MALSKRATLVRDLLEATRKEEVEWSETGSEIVFQISFPNYSLQITYQDSSIENAGLDYVIKIFNKQGALVDEFTDVQIQENDDNNGLPQAFKTMEEIYSLARSQALGVDKAFDEILSELNKYPF